MDHDGCDVDHGRLGQWSGNLASQLFELVVLDGLLPAQSHQRHFPTAIHDKLRDAGIEQQEIFATIFSQIYPWYQRQWWYFLLICGLDPITAERALVNNLASARSWADVEETLRDYTFAIREDKTFGMHPNRQRVRAYCRTVMQLGDVAHQP